MPDERSFGRWLRERRKALDLTQEALGELVGCVAETIRRFEGDRLRPSRDTAQRLAEQLDLPAAERAAFVRAARSQATVSHTPRAPGGDVVERAHPGDDGRRRHNLPVLRQPLLGRERELDDITALVRRPDVGLVTLTGAGGVGKTRLSLELATTLLDDFADGVWFVDLAPLSDPALVAPTIARTLGVPERPPQPTVEMLQNVLRTQQLLLVLDNVEHVVTAAPEVAQLLHGAPGLTILATSRTPLHIYGEREYAVPPLDLPPVDGVAEPNALIDYPAVRLFVARAQAVRHDFALTVVNAQAVADICQRLDGLPLAIELAASRTTILPIVALRARLRDEHAGQSLGLLTGGAQDVPARQRTLRSTIAWSYDGLSVEQRSFFRRLSVFRGGWTIEAAAAQCAYDGMVEVLDALSAVAQHSLLDVGEASGEPRFRMLETIREFALEQLTAAGELADARDQQARWALAYAEAAYAQLFGPDMQRWLDRLELEHDNLRAALGWALDRNGELALQLAGALGVFWLVRGYGLEGRSWLEAALEHNGAPAATAGDEQAAPMAARARAQLMLALHLFPFGDPRIGTLLEESVGLARTAHAQRVLALGLGYMALATGSQAVATEAIELSRHAGFRWEQSFALANRAEIVARQDGTRARADLNNSVQLARELGNPMLLAFVRATDGQIAAMSGDLAAAYAGLGESAALSEQIGFHGLAGRARSELAHLLRQQGDDPQAVQHYHAAIVYWQEVGHRAAVAHQLESLAMIATAQGRSRRAVQLMAAAAALREAAGAPMTATERAEHSRTVRELRTRLDAATWAALWAVGQAMTQEQAIAYALDDGSG